jgi:hypothetical protein
MRLEIHWVTYHLHSLGLHLWRKCISQLDPYFVVSHWPLYWRLNTWDNEDKRQSYHRELDDMP